MAWSEVNGAQILAISFKAGVNNKKPAMSKTSGF